MWGANGNAMGQDGMEITMNIQYAAGHTGTFEMAYSCGGTTENDLKAVRCSPCYCLGRARPVLLWVLLSTRRLPGWGRGEGFVAVMWDRDYSLRDGDCSAHYSPCHRACRRLRPSSKLAARA